MSQDDKWEDLKKSIVQYGNRQHWIGFVTGCLIGLLIGMTLSALMEAWG